MKCHKIQIYDMDFVTILSTDVLPYAAPAPALVSNFLLTTTTYLKAGEAQRGPVRHGAYSLKLGLLCST